MRRTPLGARALRVVLTGLCAAPCALPQTVPTAGLRDLPLPRPGRAIQFSSHDPSGGNVDHGHALGVDADGRRVLVDTGGPGRIVRIWSANPGGELRIELDGRAVWDGPFAALFDGSAPPFVPPLAGRAGGGFSCYVPLPFRRRARVTTTAGAELYYQIGVAKQPEAATFAPRDGVVPRADIDGLLAGPLPRDAARIEHRRGVRIGEGAVPLVRLGGAGEVVELRVRPRAFSPADWRRLWLEVRVDGEQDPCVAGPLGDLFGVGFDGEGVECQAVHGLGQSRVLCLPMPFRRGLDLRAVPVGDPAGGTARMLELDFEAAHRPLPDDHRRLYLHGAFHRQRNVWGEPFPVLRAAGRGHFVGGLFTFAGAPGQELTFLEGDDSIVVDGEDAPSFRGTGTEDLFDGAWYFRTGPFGAPFAAVSTVDARRALCAAARFRIADPIPFERSLSFDLEHGGADDAPGSDYAAMVFWYSDRAAGPAPPDAAQRLAWSRPQAAAAPIAYEAEDLWPACRRVLAGASGGAVAVLPAGEVALALPPSPELARLAGLPVLLSTEQPSGPGLDGVLVESIAAGPLDLPPLPAGTTVDRVVLEPYLPGIRAWRVAGPFPAEERRGIDTVFGPERDRAAGASYDVLGDGPRGWVDLPSPGSATGYVDLDARFGGRDHVVAYAFTAVVSPARQDAVLVLGSDDAVAVFLDGREVHKKRVLRGAARDQDHVPVTLRAGRNELLIKVEDYAGGFGFCARFEGADGLRFERR